MPKGKSRLLRITTKNEGQILDESNGLEAKISKDETRTTITMDLEIPPLPIRVCLQDPTLHIGITISIREDLITNTQIRHSIEAVQNELEVNPSIIRMEIGETMETFLVLHRLQGETSHKRTHIANQEVISLTALVSADLAIDLQLVLHLTNRSSHKAKIRHNLTLFASPQLTIPLMNYQIFAR